MKKLLLSLSLVLPLCGFAQKGMQGVGVNFGFGCDFWRYQYASNCGISYQKFVTDNFRLASSLEISDYLYDYDSYTYGYIYYYATSYLLTVEGHYFFNDIKRLRPYAIGGISVGLYNYWGEKPKSGLAGGVKLGVGLNYRIGYHWTAQLEVPIHLVYPTSLFTPSLGLVYTF